MLLSRIRQILNPALAACALLLASATPAHAIFVTGNWDPIYGQPFTNLGWRGAVVIDVSSSCLVTAGLLTNNGTVCPQITVNSAFVEFYDTTDPLLATVETLNFLGLVAVDTLSVSAGLVTDGFSLTSLGAVASTHPLAAVPLGPNAQFSLSFALTNAGTTETTALLGWQARGETGTNDGQYPARVRITSGSIPGPGPGQVPEPGSLALAFGALGGLLLAKRRRRAA